MGKEDTRKILTKCLREAGFPEAADKADVLPDSAVTGDLVETCTAQAAVIGGIDWTESPQGSSYWSHIHDQLINQDSEDGVGNTSDEQEFREELFGCNEFGYHEVIDRINCTCGSIDDTIRAHPVVQSHPDIDEKVDKATEMLSDAYQLLSNYSYEKFEKQKD